VAYKGSSPDPSAYSILDITISKEPLGEMVRTQGHKRRTVPNFLEGPITPFVNGTIGYSFIDTNIPDGPPQSGCWWDPWYGQICGTWQSTRSVDEFIYGAGLGVRWDTSDTLSVKLEYQKRWIDSSNAGSPDFDQLKLGLSWMY